MNDDDGNDDVDDGDNVGPSGSSRSASSTFAFSLFVSWDVMLICSSNSSNISN